MELAHANRLATIGQLTASITHEVTQPVAGAIVSAQAALHWLARAPPNLDEARQALTRVVKDGNRVSEVIAGIRAMVKKAPARKHCLPVNEAIIEVVALTHGETIKNGVSVQTQLAEGLPLIEGDRVQLQQVMLNLIINAVEEMSGATEGARDLLISTGRAGFQRCARLGPGFGSGTGTSGSRASFRSLLHDQVERLGAGAVDLSFDHRGARRTIVGNLQRAARRHL